MHPSADLNGQETAESFAPRRGRSASLFGLILSFMLVVVLLFVGIEGWRIWRDYRHAFASAHDAVTNLASATAQHAEDAIRQVDVVTAMLGERLEGDGLARMNISRLHRLLKQQAAMMPQVHGLFVYGSDGHWIVTDKTDTPTNANNADRDYFEYHRTHEDRGVFIGSVVKSRSTGDLIIPISRRLDNPDGSFFGVLLGTIKVDYFVEFYGEFKIDDRGALVLAKRDGTILVRRPFVERVIGGSLAGSEIFQKYLPQSHEGVVETQAVVDGTQRLYAYKALDAYPLVVEAGLSRASIIDPWREDLIKTAVVLLLLLVGLSGFGALVLRQLRERIVMEAALRRAHQTVRDLALSDSLTGLGNRRRLDTALAQEIRRAKRQGYPLALVMMDLDYFKLFNDNYGHPAGDDCLRAVGAAIQGSLKRPGDLAVRYGGEEFTLLLPNTDAAGASTIVEGILQAIRALNIEHVKSPAGKVTASAGIALGYPIKEAVAADSLMGAADSALYRAKDKGRNGWCLVDGLSGRFYGF
ncbi:sensor domain-containing diguanylate cyclase, partial [Pseudomonas sp. TNT2022 ID609]